MGETLAGMANANGEWKGRFMKRLGDGSDPEAEAWATLYGLRIAWERGIRKLIIMILY